MYLNTKTQNSCSSKPTLIILAMCNHLISLRVHQAISKKKAYVENYLVRLKYGSIQLTSNHNNSKMIFPFFLTVTNIHPRIGWSVLVLGLPLFVIGPNFSLLFSSLSLNAMKIIWGFKGLALDINCECHKKKKSRLYKQISLIHVIKEKNGESCKEKYKNFHQWHHHHLPGQECSSYIQQRPYHKM